MGSFLSNIFEENGGGVGLDAVFSFRAGAEPPFALTIV
jgi:hypothetical protein